MQVTMQDRNLGSIVAVGDADGRITIWQTRAKYFHPLEQPPPDEQLDLPMQEVIVGELFGNGSITTMAFSSYQADHRLAVGSSTGLRYDHTLLPAYLSGHPRCSPDTFPH